MKLMEKSKGSFISFFFVINVRKCFSGKVFFYGSTTKLHRAPPCAPREAYFAIENTNVGVNLH